MPRRELKVSPEIPHAVVEGLELLRSRLEVPISFPGDVLAEAEHLRKDPPGFPRHTDRTVVELVTVDPASSKDLDQAVRIERRGAGYRVYYAIADVAAWVRPGSSLEAEAKRRGETLYAPGAKVPLYPDSFSEGVGSLLADGRPRPAVLWTHDLDADGEPTGVGVERALVRSYAKLSYDEVQTDLNAGRAHPSVALLPVVGALRERLEVERGGVSLNLPGQEIIAENGTWRTRFRSPLPVERYNAQVSLLTGMAAAELMVGAAVGILRTLPAAAPEAVDRLRLSAEALGVDWPVAQSYPDFVRGLEPGEPAELAVLARCASLFRGAGYQSFDGSLPEDDLGHAALAARYTHVTAPLRRLVDRFASEICVSIGQGEPAPGWAREHLTELPELMAASNRRARAWEHAVVDLAEALVLQTRVGEVFDAVLIDVNPRSGMGTFQIADPAVEAKLPADGREPGRAVRVRLDEVELNEGRTVFSYAA